MAGNQGWGPGDQGGFFRILGIIYLIKAIRRRREQRRLDQDDGTGET
jgi:hypothetical protein